MGFRPFDDFRTLLRESHYVENESHKNTIFHHGIWPFNRLLRYPETRILSFENSDMYIKIEPLMDPETNKYYYVNYIDSYELSSS